MRLPRAVAQVQGGVLRCVAMSEPVQSLTQAGAAAPRDSVTESDAGFLWDFWYPAVRSAEVAGNRLAKAMLLEVPLVLGRTSEGAAIRVLTGGFRFRMDDSTGKRSSAAITDGDLKLAVGSALKFRR